ncbi:type II toxin-antitoxin system Phd/YefM family antitoxin [Geodermatophilus maliterrae]|uniref:Antitoxin n=1 Tax=Geodermatophilus maliterrae TaxID=3162531 RepID=A0ABV3XDF1_9ACTN
MDGAARDGYIDTTEGSHKGGRMRSVGVRELRDGLSRYLADVRSGRTITVTDHGRPVARIVPVGQPTALERLIAEGVVQPAGERRRSLPEPVRATGSVSELVIDERG